MLSPFRFLSWSWTIQCALFRSRKCFHLWSPVLMLQLRWMLGGPVKKGWGYSGLYLSLGSFSWPIGMKVSDDVDASGRECDPIYIVISNNLTQTNVVRCLCVYFVRCSLVASPAVLGTFCSACACTAPTSKRFICIYDGSLTSIIIMVIIWVETVFQVCCGRFNSAEDVNNTLFSGELESGFIFLFWVYFIRLVPSTVLFLSSLKSPV